MFENTITTRAPMLAPNVEIIPATIKQIEQDPSFEPKKLKVAAYARVSTEQDEQQSSYATQVSYYTNYIKSNPDWEFVAVFADEGITGTNIKKRKGFNKMIEAAKRGEIDKILTKSISRFARNTVDTLQTVRELQACNVEVVFEKENIHTLDPKCEMMLTILSSLAQEESRSISENIRWAQEKNRKAGIVSMAYSNFLGYRKGEDGRPEIVPEEAEIIRGIYNDYLAGNTITQIADSLTARGIPTPMKKTKWSIRTVNSILQNEKYMGEAILQKTYTVDYLTKEVRKNNGERPMYHIRESHPPIIEPEVFMRVQRELERRRNARPRKVGTGSPFANRIVCSDCGAFYGHKVWQSRGVAAKRTDVWYCNHRYNGEEKCTTPTLREADIQAAFVKVLKRRKQPEPNYSDSLWRQLVESVTISPDRKAAFLLTDGHTVTVEVPIVK